MNLTTHERPGVYSSYDASTLVRGSGGHKTVGLAAINSTASAGVPITVTSYEAAVAAFGSQEGKQDMAELIRIALLNGAAAVVAVPAANEEGYQAAFDTLGGLENISVMLKEADATTRDITQAITKLRDMADYAVVKKYFEAHYPDLPHLIVLAPVCRPGWLIETECIAVVPTESSFKPL